MRQLIIMETNTEDVLMGRNPSLGLSGATCALSRKDGSAGRSRVLLLTQICRSWKKMRSVCRIN